MRQASSGGLWKTLLRHGFLAAGLALALGLVDGALAARHSGMSLARGLTLGAGVLLLCGAAFGVVQAVLVSAFNRFWEPSSLRTRWQATTSREASQREPVVRFHAWLATGLVVAGVATLVFAVFVRGLERIKEASLRDVLLLLGVATALGAFAVVSALTAPLFERLLAKLDGRWRLPLPGWLIARRLIYLWLPAMALCWPLFLSYGVKLGVLAWPLATLSFVATEAVLLPVVDAIAARARRRWKRAPAVVLVGLACAMLGLALASGVLFSQWNRARQVAATGVVLPFAVVALQQATDFDRDGLSSLFGGRDCAPFDSARSPARPEIPGNGIDEDCDGHDLDRAEGLEKLPVFSSWTAKGQSHHFNVLWFIVDSLRPDHMQVYGYRNKTTPYLQQLASTSWVFDAAYSQSSTTALSVPSSLAGRWPGRMNWRPGGFPSADPRERMLPEMLGEQGYETTLVLNSWVRSRLPGLARGFTSTRVAPKQADWRSGEFVLSNTVLAIEQARQKQTPFFVVAHIDDVHHPYTAHRGYPLPSFGGKGRDIQGYDRGIALFDTLVRLVSAHLKNVGLWEDTILLVTSDHGEEFQEHGGTIHSASCYQEVVHVPLIMRVPGFPGKRLKQRVALIDLVPTFAELLGLEPDAASWDGQSLLVAVEEPDAVEAKRPIFCSIYQLLKGRKPFFTRAVRDGEYTLIHEMLSDRVELYAAGDTAEKTDLSGDADHSDQMGVLKALLGHSLTGNLFSLRGK